MSIIVEDKIKKEGISEGIMNEKNAVKKLEKNRELPKIITSFADIFPITDLTEYDSFEMKDGEYMDIIQVTSKDIYSLNDSDKDNDIFSLAYLFQAYISDIKIVPLNTPVNYEIQKNNIMKNIRNAKTKSYIPFLEKKYAELEFLEEHRTNKEYFFFIYADSPKELVEKKTYLRKLLAKSNPLIEVDLQKKINVLYQLSNLNSKPIND